MQKGFEKKTLLVTTPEIYWLLFVNLGFEKGNNRWRLSAIDNGDTKAKTKAT